MAESCGFPRTVWLVEVVGVGLYEGGLVVVDLVLVYVRLKIPVPGMERDRYCRPRASRPTRNPLPPMEYPKPLLDALILNGPKFMLLRNPQPIRSD